MKHAGEELVAVADIGRRLGVTRQAAQQLAKRPGFPDPVGQLGRSRIWRWRDVETWRAARAKTG